MSLEKPKRGTATRAHRSRSRADAAFEANEKVKVRERDGQRCRWPGCDAPGYSLEVAHLRHKGMGGNPARDRSTRDQMITLCIRHHRGPISFDSGHLQIRPVTELGTDGQCEFSMSYTESSLRFLEAAQ